MIHINEKHIALHTRKLSSMSNDEGQKLQILGFSVKKEELMSIVVKYKDRKYGYEDLDEIDAHQGDATILSKLSTHPDNGISSTEGRSEEFGTNTFFVKPIPHFCEYIAESLEDLMLRILIFAAIVQIVLGTSVSDQPERDWVDGLSIVIALVVVVMVGSITNWNKEHKFRELNDIQKKACTYTVTRNGISQNVIPDHILVGDLLTVNLGDCLPADAMLISGNCVKMDEASLTGESSEMKKSTYAICKEIKQKELTELEKLKKDDPMKARNKKLSIPSPILLSGTNVVEGSGKAIVLAVGPNSQKGIIKGIVDNSQEDAKTPLEEKLDIIAGQIGWFGIAAGLVTLIALFIRFGISYADKDTAYYAAAQKSALFSAYIQNNPLEITNSTILNVINSNLTNPKLLVANHVLKIILLCISIVVVAIPEGLPLAVTLSLAFSIRKMMEEQNLVRKMHACETMGGANFICTDKTGTLTKNEMAVVRIFDGKKCIDIPEVQVYQDEDGTSNIPTQNPGEKKNLKVKLRESYTKYFTNEYFNLFKLALALNVIATINDLDKPNDDGDLETVERCNKTDQAFIDFLYRLRTPINPERKKYFPSLADVKQIPFSSERKRMSTLVASNEFPTGYRLFTKGGADYLLKDVTHYFDPDTQQNAVLQDSERQKFSEMVINFNNDTLRTLCICYRDLTEDQYNNFEECDEKGPTVDRFQLVLIAICGIRDVLRENVAEAVNHCHKAGVDVIMVTGDNIFTAVSIAKKCNILDKTKAIEIEIEEIEKPSEIKSNVLANSDEIETIDLTKREHCDKTLQQCPDAMTGSTFYEIIGGVICEKCNQDSEKVCKCPKTKEEAAALGKTEVKKDKVKNMDTFAKITTNLKVLARSFPSHKYALVLGLRALKNVVAVTGDGTNDAPALSRSDVGFAMGRAGTDIAKGASDIIILDDNFSSIVVAILWGRNIYDNIRRFLQFQLTVNFCACVLVFICACIGNETPLVPIQMLWVNLIMDSLGSLSLATEPPYKELLVRSPTKRGESIINGKMWKHIIIQALFQLGVLLFLYLYAPYFIEEQDFIRLAENETIKRCYGELPGGEMDIRYIIHGSSSMWSSSKSLKAGMGEAHCGVYSKYQDLAMAFKPYININGGSAHMTIVFNVFVFYTLFNQFNARILDDSFNIFLRIHKNLFFPAIALTEAALQVLIIEFGNVAFHVCETGLTGQQWGICIGFSSIAFGVSFLAKLIPLDICLQKFLERRRIKWANNQEKEEDATDPKSNRIANIHDLESKEAERLNATSSQVDVKKTQVKLKTEDTLTKNVLEVIRNPNKRKSLGGIHMRSSKMNAEFD